MDWLTALLDKTPTKTVLVGIAALLIFGGGWLVGRVNTIEARVSTHDIKDVELGAAIQLLTKISERQDKRLDEHSATIVRILSRRRDNNP